MDEAMAYPQAGCLNPACAGACTAAQQARLADEKETSAMTTVVS